MRNYRKNKKDKTILICLKMINDLSIEHVLPLCTVVNNDPLHNRFNKLSQTYTLIHVQCGYVILLSIIQSSRYYYVFSNSYGHPAPRIGRHVNIITDYIIHIIYYITIFHIVCAKTLSSVNSTITDYI